VVEPRAERLAKLFPEAVRDGKLDLDALRAALGDVVDEGFERFGLTWPGKLGAIRTAQTPSDGTLVPIPEQSVDWEATGNVIVEGENLEVLKLLQRSYHGAVKLIYIDPPYNTGKDFVYPDNFREPLAEYLRYSGQVDAEGGRMRANTESGGRFHSAWLSMMWPRLHLARSLLREDGVIVVSINDVEAAHLRLMLDEIFGSENFVGQIVVQLNPRGRHLDRFLATTHEYLLVYARDATEQALYPLEKDERMTSEYRHEDAAGRYREIELRNRNPAFNRQTRPNLYYPIYADPESGAVSLSRDLIHSVEVLPRNRSGGDSCWTWSSSKFDRDRRSLFARQMEDGGWRVFRKDYLFAEDGSRATTLPKSIWADKDMNNDHGKKAIQELFDGRNVFYFPKSPAFLERVVRLGSRADDLVLDFFAGSGTTAQAVMAANEVDDGARRYILVQLPEPIGEDAAAWSLGHRTLAELTRERVRRAGERLDGDRPGFRSYRLTTSNFTSAATSGTLFVDNVEPGRTDEALLAEVLLARGFELTVPVRWVDVEGARAASVADGALLACFSRNLTLELFEALLALEPAQLIVLEAGFGADDELKVNALQQLKTENVHRDTAIELLVI
jgi:adenine-specific DNA-methyltransferase